MLDWYKEDPGSNLQPDKTVFPSCAFSDLTHIMLSPLVSQGNKTEHCCHIDLVTVEGMIDVIRRWFYYVITLLQRVLNDMELWKMLTLFSYMKHPGPKSYRDLINSTFSWMWASIIVIVMGPCTIIETIIIVLIIVQLLRP